MIRDSGFDPKVKPLVVRVAMNEYTVDFSAGVEDLADSIIERSDDPGIRRNAVLWKLNATPAMRMACFRRGAVAASIDAWALSAQMTAFFDRGAGADLFGPYQEEVVLLSRTLERRARDAHATAMASEEDLDAFERTVIKPWVEENPIRALTFARPSIIAQFAGITVDSGGVIGDIASLEQQVYNLQTQARIYLAHAPKVVRWEAQLLRDDLLGDLDLEGLSRSAADAADAATRAADVAEATPELIRDERRAVLADLDRHITALIEAIGAQREAIVTELKNERVAIVEAVGTERVELLAEIGRPAPRHPRPPRGGAARHPRGDHRRGVAHARRGRPGAARDREQHGGDHRGRGEPALRPRARPGRDRHRRGADHRARLRAGLAAARPRLRRDGPRRAGAHRIATITAHSASGIANRSSRRQRRNPGPSSRPSSSSAARRGTTQPAKSAIRIPPTGSMTLLAR